ncbi:MAG: Metallo-beta-lactamase superfamily protein [Mucilaginibacter sp.]|nr:Metallo-beta-lactamase superfamily protein [Mucilaginibacter sp.]
MTLSFRAGLIYLFMQNNTLPALNNPQLKNICHTCGTCYAEDSPVNCPICDDERQYVPVSGQQWVNYNELSKTKSIRFGKLLPNVYDLRISPSFAIAQKAHLIISQSGNLLWDCLPFLDEATVAFIHSKGGIKGIAISHPHYYSLMTAWAEIFDCPIYLHAADKKWVMDKSDYIVFFESEKYALWDGMEIIHTGGHFAGSTVLHTPFAGSGGSLFVGDTLQISQSRQFISMMYSYPNQIPLPLIDILRISEKISPLKFDSMYGAFEWQNINKGAKAIFEQSVKRYVDVYKTT